MLLEELEDKQRWDRRSPDALALLADQAIAENHAGKAQQLDPDTL